jgi:tetratricopeptide (TPR) repeat protein
MEGPMNSKKVFRIGTLLAVAGIGGYTLSLALDHFPSFYGPEREFRRLLSEDSKVAAEWKDAAENSSQEKMAQWRPRVEQLKKKFQDFIQRHPEDARAMLAYANLLDDLKRPDEAITWLEKAMAADAHNARVCNNLANHYGETGRAEKALRYYDKAIELEPSNALFRCNWATCCVQFRAEATAVYGWDIPEIFRRCLDQYRRARDLAPKDFTYSSAYAETFSMVPRADLKEAHAAWRYCLGQSLSWEQRQRVFCQLSLVNMRLEQFDESRFWIGKIDEKRRTALRRALERKLAVVEAGASGPAPSFPLVEK